MARKSSAFCSSTILHSSYCALKIQKSLKHPFAKKKVLLKLCASWDVGPSKSKLCCATEAVQRWPIWTRLFPHLSSLISLPKGIPDSLKDILDTTVKMVNFVKARPLNSRVCYALCNDMGSDLVTLLQHTEGGWVSRG